MNQNEIFMNWDNPGVALITGASSGIGEQFAYQIAQKGFDLILVARRKEKLEALNKILSDKYSIQTDIIIADLSNPNDIEKIIATIMTTNNLDILVNNAGYGINRPFLEWKNAESSEMINVLYVAPVRFCHAVLPGMIERGRGIIINNASSSALIKSDPIYSSSKAALVVFSEIMKPRIKEKDVHIQALCPGFTYSEFHDTATMEGFDREDYANNQWMTAEDVVKDSLHNIKSKSVIFIPGEENRILLKAIRKSTLKKYLNLKIF